ncbi:adhesive plaque matrix protein 2-like [Ischnura elegans]|uniref:adhesive plaque matrix protein 2-like n=1 Tax=Ischnura elegans TaxID=197161 RepID=UPI001ED88790|nr:adhesive plaque matrix protein 2-like [Ischnura elegans]
MFHQFQEQVGLTNQRKVSPLFVTANKRQKRVKDSSSESNVELSDLCNDSSDGDWVEFCDVEEVYSSEKRFTIDKKPVLQKNDFILVTVSNEKSKKEFVAQSGDIPTERQNPCSPSPCGPNSQCREVNGHAVCSCITGYFGSPPSCRPECIVSSECPISKACVNQKCIDPCQGACGIGARCEEINHSPICNCRPGQTGDPFKSCYNVPQRTPILNIPTERQNPCSPSPCGPNSQCREVNGHAVCSCITGYFGSPPSCRPECIVSSECPISKACVNRECIDPCQGACGIGARCDVINHSPICSCRPGQTGDPFKSCYNIPPPVVQEISMPCHPSPCGANAICREQNGAGSCTCIEDHFGNPYEGCRPECLINSDCPSVRACVQKKCQDPCPGTCGQNAHCQVVNHLPSCTCHPGYAGDPFRYCSPTPAEPQQPVYVAQDPCNPSPCGPNAQCRDGICTCAPEYGGDPYLGCRPECVLSTDCPRDKACIRQKCADPCPGTCGQNARCEVVNHIPICSCPPGYSGNAFVDCRIYQEPVVTQPCQPSPCGPNSQCREVNNQAVCSCVAGYVGSPPTCRPECVVNSDCSQSEACSNQKCRNPCPGTCGVGARCEVINHNPICSCPSRYTGDPFVKCSPILFSLAVPSGVNSSLCYFFNCRTNCGGEGNALQSITLRCQCCVQRAKRC